MAKTKHPGPEQLGGTKAARQRIEQVVRCNSAFEKGEVPLARLYWQLGDAIALLRPDFPYGTWNAFLRRNDITPTRASNARKIREAFATPDDIRGGTIEQLLAASPRRPRPRHRRPPPDPSKLTRVLLEFSLAAESWAELSSSFSPRSAQDCLKLARAAERSAQKLVCALERQVRKTTTGRQRPRNAK